MEESPVIQEGPPTVLPLQCVLKENDSSNSQWQEFSEKPNTQNSRLLVLTVEYVQDNSNNNGIEFNNYATNLSENEEIVSFESSLSPVEKFSSLYNALVLPNEGLSQFQNSVVVLPSRNSSQQINIIVDESQMPKELLVSGQKNFQTLEILDNVKLDSEVSQLVVNSQSSFIAQINSHQNSPDLNQKLIITTPRVDLPENTRIESVESNSDHVRSSSANSFFQGEREKIIATADFVSSCNDSAQSDISSSTSDGEVLLNRANEAENKSLLDPLKYSINGPSLKRDELLLSDSDQNNELLMKSEELMDSYNLPQGTYITPEDGNSYPIMEEHLKISGIEKGDNEYLLPDTIAFADADSNILQSNLEVFPPQGLDTSGLLLYDKTKLRQKRKHPIERLGFDYCCEDCEFGIKCVRHEVKIISDKPVLSRARATLPKELLAINKLQGNINGEGVFARKTIMRRVQFGPVEGRLCRDWENSKENDFNAVELLLEVETGHLLKVDVSNENDSNWMRFVRKANTLREQNLILTQQGKSLYFTTTRVIPPRQELRVGYSPQYAERRKLTILEDLLWSCFECTKKFSSSNELQKHLNVHENEKDFCGKFTKKKQRNLSFKGVSNLARRKGNRRQGQSVYLPNGKEKECWNCHKIFFKSCSLKRHLLLVHSEKDKENAGIVKTIKDKNEKISVTNTLFKKKQSNGAVSEWLCTHCNLTFDNPSVLNLHTLTHAAEDLESEAVLGLPSELSSVYHEGEFLVQSGDVQCPQCTQEFSSKRELIDHVSTHGKMTLGKSCSNPSKPYKCDQCYKSFATDTRLQKHMLVHGSDESKPYQCETCSKRFLNNSALSCHLKTHNGKKCFECPMCKKEFEQIFGLKEHVKSHSIDGLYTCPHCYKVFDEYTIVRKHIRAFHSGHQHICKDCGKSCLTLDKLRMHSLKHSDHREFLCANCGKQFKRKDKLKEHMKRMHSIEREMKLMSLALKIPNSKERRLTPKMSPLSFDRFIYKCRDCMVGFKRRGMLVNHLAKRHPDIVPDSVPELNLPILKTTRDYFCQYCDKIYKSSSKRKAHILKNHPGAQLPLSNRQKGGVPHIPGIPNPTFSQTVGSIKTTPHACKWCHKQYASKAKLLQHQRKKHISLLPKSQQIPRLSKNPSFPVSGKKVENLDSPPQVANWKGNEEFSGTDCGKIRENNDVHNTQGTFNVSSEFNQDLDEFKKGTKVVSENISSELLQQAMTELSQTLSDYKLPFSGTEENLLKIVDVKTEGEIVTRDNVPAAQMSRTWPDLPPYPPC